MILNASAENGALSSAVRVASFSSSSMPCTGGRSDGDGSRWITPSSMAWTPLFLNAVPQNTGTISTFRVRSRSPRSEEHTSELQSLMRSSYDVFCLKKKKKQKKRTYNKYYKRYDNEQIKTKTPVSEDHKK